MGWDRCPRCDHTGLRQTDVMDRDSQHKTRGTECPNCGWTNIPR